MATYLDFTGAVKRLVKSVSSAGANQSDRLIATDANGLLSNTLTNEPGARVTHSVAQSTASGSNLVLSFDTLIYGQTGVWSGATPTRLTAPISGSYIGALCIAFAPNATGVRSALIRKNGTEFISVARIPTAGSGLPTIIAIPFEINLAAGDYVQALAHQNSGVALDVQVLASYSPSFWMRRSSSNYII